MSVNAPDIKELAKKLFGPKKLAEAELNKISKKISARYVSEIEKEEKFTFVDLFAGIGGTRIAFEAVGGKCVFTSEWDLNAQKTYFANFGEVPHGDITKISEKDIPKHDVLVAGFPCQAFSIAGERKGFTDTRGTLFFDTARIIKYHRPKTFLLENVKGLMGHDGGRTFDTIMNVLKYDLKYDVSFQVMNTKEFGNVPQSRERLYIVGFRKDLKTAKDDLFSFPSPLKLKRSIRDLIREDQQAEKYYYNKSVLYPKLKKEMKSFDTIYQWRRKYVRENKSGVCPTLTANMGTGGHNVPLVLDKFGIRKLTPRECALFQGFPNKFHLPSFLADSHLYKQLGNSVSVPVIQRIAGRMASILEQTSHKKQRKSDQLRLL